MISSACIDVNHNSPVVTTNFCLTSYEFQYLNKVYQHFHETLNSHNKALAYLSNSRGLSDNSIEKFHLGYCDKSYTADFLNSSGAPEKLRGLLQGSGLIKPTGHHLFNGSVIFPVLHKGGILGAYGRRLSNRVMMDSTAYPFHLVVENLFFNQDILNHRPSFVVLVKSPLEAISAIQLGAENVLSLIGSEYITTEHAKTLEQCGVKLVKFAYNLSLFNQKLIKRNASVFKRIGIKTKVANLADWQDINQLLVCETNAQRVMNRILKQTQTIKGA